MKNQLKNGLFLLVCAMLVWSLVSPKNNPTSEWGELAYAGPAKIADPSTGEMMNVKYAVINASSTDNTIVAAVTGKRIRPIAYLCVLNTAGATYRFESGAAGTALTGQIPAAQYGGSVIPCYPFGCFQTASATLLNLELSSGTANGWLAYVEASTTGD